MAAIGRFQKGEDIFHAKVVDGKLYKLKGDVFGSPSSSLINDKCSQSSSLQFLAKTYFILFLLVDLV